MFFLLSAGAFRSLANGSKENPKTIRTSYRNAPHRRSIGDGKAVPRMEKERGRAGFGMGSYPGGIGMLLTGVACASFDGFRLRRDAAYGGYGFYCCNLATHKAQFRSAQLLAGRAEQAGQHEFTVANRQVASVG